MGGRSAFELTPVYQALMADLKRCTKLFMDETPEPVLAPGRRRTKTGDFWTLARDDRPWGGEDPPGVAFTYAPGRPGQYADNILKGFNGTLQVDGYLCDVLTAIAGGHKQNHINELLPWNYTKAG